MPACRCRRHRLLLPLQFLNSVLPGGMLGDVHRGLRHGIDVGDLGRGLRAVVWERVAGQVVQAAVAVAVLLVLPSPVHAAMPAVAVSVRCGRGPPAAHGPRCGAARSAPPGRAPSAAPRSRPAVSCCSPPPVRPVLLASLLVVVGHVGMFLLACHAAGVHGTPEQLLPLALVVLLAAAIPLNVGGWGPREGAAAWIFAATEWGAGAGAAVATAFGVLTLVAVLPGPSSSSRAGGTCGRQPSGRQVSGGNPWPTSCTGGPREDGAAHG